MDINFFGVFTFIIFIIILLFNYFNQIWKDPGWSQWYFELVVLLIFSGLIIGIVI